MPFVPIVQPGAGSSHGRVPELTRCPGCNALVDAAVGATHAYYGAAPACWSVYGEVLAREYSDYRYARFHGMTVDAYAVQHPGRPERRAIQSVAVHLIGLHLSLESTSAIRALPTVLQLAADQSANYHWLEPPPSLGDITVHDVHAVGADPAAHMQVVRQWAESTWAAWTPHHAQIRRWAAALTSDGGSGGKKARR